jgi:hypothetical protein
MWIERQPEQGETVKFLLDERHEIGVYLRRGNGSAQTFWIIDIGDRRVWAWELTTFEVWENRGLGQ